MKCPNCNKINDKTNEKCGCGYQFVGYVEKLDADINEKKSSPYNEKKGSPYPATNFLSKLSNIFAWISIIGGPIITLFLIDTLSKTLPKEMNIWLFLYFIGGLFASSISFLFWKLLSEGLIILTDIAGDLKKIRNWFYR